MESMFERSREFDQNISGWNISSVGNAVDFDTDSVTTWTIDEKPAF